MNRQIVDRWCERGILGLVLGILVSGPLAIGATRTVPFLVIQGLTVGILALWGARLWLNPRPQLLWPPICWAVVAFTAYAIVRYFTADIEYVARQELIRILVYAFLFFAILNNLYRQESAQVICCTLVFLAMAISFYAVYQFLTHSDRVWYFPVRADFGASGTYLSRNHLGGFLEMILPLGLAYTLTSRLKPLVKILLGYASLVILAGIGVTISRGTYASTALAMLLFFAVLLLRRKYRLPSLVLLVALVAAGAYFLPRSLPVQRRLKLLFEGGGRVEEDTRAILWRTAIQVWQENRWWGVGPAHYDYRFRQFRTSEVQLRPGWAHNDYLNALAEWGIVGTTLVASAWILLGLGVLKTWRAVGNAPTNLGDQRNSNKFALVLGASVGLTAILTHSAVDFNLHIPANAILAVALMALLSSCLRFATDRFWVSLGTGGKLGVAAVVLAGAALLGQQGSRHGREHVWLSRAALAPAFSPAQAACLQKAFAAEPMNSDTAYAIGEALRFQSSEGDDNHEELAQQAMAWYQRSMKLNPWNGYSYLRYGWCLDWLERFSDSPTYFQRAAQLDPNGYFMAANIGLHYVQLHNFAAARSWFERSLCLEAKENAIARNYLQIVNSRLLEAATNEMSAQLDSRRR